ncbi:MAG: enoyl-CoA hydratase/isomerase family protein [Marmoricola sp.]
MTLPDSAALEAAGLLLEIDDAVATVTLNKPDQRNSQTPRMWRTLAQIGAGLPDSIRIVVLKGAGKAFSAGLDRAMFTPEGLPDEQGIPDLINSADDVILDAIAEFQAGFAWLRDPRFVSIAAVQGYAIGGGFQLALGCDLRVVADDVQFSMKEPALGIVPDVGGTQPLVECVGYSRALDICVTTRFVGAEEAHAIGLANRVAARDDLESATQALVDEILAINEGAVRETTALLQGAARIDAEAQRLRERQAQVRRFHDLRG